MSHSIPNTLRNLIDENKVVLEMCTTEQMSAMLSTVPEQWITGPAGSGKTWLLMQKVLKLAKNALLNGTKEKILVACYNKPLSMMFVRVFKDELILSLPESGDLKEVVEVKTFDSLLHDITGFMSGDSDQERAEHIAQALELVETGTMFAQKYDHIFVDDCEDLCGDSWPTLFKRMLKDDDVDEDDDFCEPKHIWFFYDPNQNLRISKELSQQHRESIRKSFRLSKVFRNTQMIFEQSKKYFKSNQKPIEIGHGVRGSEIKWDDSQDMVIFNMKYGVRLIKKHIEDLRRQKVNDKDICILTQSGTIRDKISLELKKRGIESQNAEQMFQNDDNKIVVESIWRFKGLESKVVVLYCPPPIQDIDVTPRKNSKALLYIAFSRCFCYLIVISTARGCNVLKSGKGFEKLSKGGSKLVSSRISG